MKAYTRVRLITSTCGPSSLLYMCRFQPNTHTHTHIFYVCSFYLFLPVWEMLCSEVLCRGWTLKSRARVPEWVGSSHRYKYTCPFNIYYGITVYVLGDKRIPCECRRTARVRGIGHTQTGTYILYSMVILIHSLYALYNICVLKPQPESSHIRCV